MADVAMSETLAQRPDHCPDREQHEPHEWIGAALRVDCPGGMHVVAGTGSRSLRVDPREVQVEAMELCTEAVAQRVVEHDRRLVVMSGGAEGFDELLARVAIKLGVRLHLVLPNRGYAHHYWSRASLLGRDRWPEFAEIAEYAERITYVMEGIHGTSELKLNGLHANFWRNLHMVQTADDFLVWNPTSRGTAHCVTEIKKSGKPYTVLSPEPATLL